MTTLTDQTISTDRSLTTLEYVILSFLAVGAHSGYDILQRLETGLYRTSASTGSVYPVLKRLEAAGLCESVLEAEHETRPRKVYSLTATGMGFIDLWLRQAPDTADVVEHYDLMLHKFLIAEHRLSRAEVLEWLIAYEQVTEGSLRMRQAIFAASDPTLLSTHVALIKQSLDMEVEARLNWIHAALAKLRTD